MRKKRLLIVLFAAIIIVIALIAVIPDKVGKTGRKRAGKTEQDSLKIEDRVLAEKDFRKKSGGSDEGDGERMISSGDLFWEQGNTAVDSSSDTVYLPCGLQKELTWREVLDGLEPADRTGIIWFKKDDAMKDLPTAIAKGHPFSALLVTGEENLEFNVILTGLPALCIDKTDPDEIVRKETHTGTISLIPRLGEDNEAGMQEMHCNFHVRGNVASFYKKKPYKVSLLDANGHKQKKGLLDLRSDDDWILNPMYSDQTRVREATAYALWDQVTALSDSPVPSSRIRYIELFLDDSYEGIYGLMEPVDKKQLSLSQGDILYKIDKWDYEYPYMDLYEEMEEKKETSILTDRGVNCVEIRYPLNWDSTATWKPMQVFHEFCFVNGDSTTLSAAGLHTDPENTLDLSLFCALTHAMDNNWKNTFLICRRRSAREYDLSRTLWDLNYVFGDVFIFDPQNRYSYFDTFTAEVYEPEEDSTFDFEAFLAEDPAVWSRLCGKWKEWREGGISADMICSTAESNMRILKESGAIDREMQRWPQSGTPEEALEKMENWIGRRFDFLDKYLEGDS